jgi:pyridoxal phosphate enzyme (YggS family)
MTIADNVERVRARVTAAAERAGRDPADVTIVAATKYVNDSGLLKEAVAAGITDLGENTAQALVAKAEAVGPGPRWHYLGSVQTNKIKLLDAVDLVQSVDRSREAQALQRRAEATDRSFDVLIEVNLAGEATKQGVAPDGLGPLLEAIEPLDRVFVRGLMFVAHQAENAEDVRWLFTEGRRLRDRYGPQGLTELSMGMTEDYEVAVEEGATIVRIGRAIFRPS